MLGGALQRLRDSNEVAVAAESPLLLRLPMMSVSIGGVLAQNDLTKS